MIAPQRAVADIASVAAHYDDLDPFYRAVWGHHLHHGYWITGKESSEEAVLNLTRLVGQRAEIKKGTRVCDVGCGYGASARIFNQHFGAKVTGMTISRKQYEIATALAERIADLNFLLCDALHNGLPDASFDSVVAIESSEHMPDKPGFFAEVNRLLDRGGRFVVAAWLARERPSALETKYLLEPICAEGRLPNMPTAMEYRTMLGDAGFHEIFFTDLTRRVSKTWSRCARRFILKISTDASLRRPLFDPKFSNRVFAKTIFRIWLAYKTGSMGYGVFAMRK